MSDKSERRAARSVVAAYHQAELEGLLARVVEAVDRYRGGELDTFDVDQVLFQYSRAAKEIWKYCNLLQPEAAAAMIRELPHTTGGDVVLREGGDAWRLGDPDARCHATATRRSRADRAPLFVKRCLVRCSRVVIGGSGK